MGAADALTRAREAIDAQSWTTAFEQLVLADSEASLEPSGLEQLAAVAFLIGRDDASVDVWARAYQKLLDQGDRPRAARCAFWAAFQLLNVGEIARGGGWLARAQGVLEDCPQVCVERGYVLAPMGIQQFESGDVDAAHATFTQALAKGITFADPDLLALARLGLAHTEVVRGNTETGVQLFDEVMVSVTAGEVVPAVAGIAYCATIMACQERYDVGRATEWTRALSHWCEAQPDLVQYRGQCLVHRAELMQLQGAWPDAMREVQQARDRLADPPGQPAMGMAYYQQGELHRLRGEFTQADTAFRQASRYGREPQPGLALLWLVQDRVEGAAAAISRALDEASDRLARSRLLPAFVDIMIAASDLPRAQTAAAEIADLADEIDAPFLRALSAHASGAVELAAGEPRSALAFLRQAWLGWQRIEAPYQAARVRVLIGLACRALGDADSASMEFDAARLSFQQLGAAFDVVAVERLTSTTRRGTDGTLTEREAQVLSLLATGATNRAIAVELVISEKTVARHVSNIFTKLGVSSRAAATAYAYEHGLV